MHVDKAWAVFSDDSVKIWVLSNALGRFYEYFNLPTHNVRRPQFWVFFYWRHCVVVCSGWDKIPCAGMWIQVKIQVGTLLHQVGSYLYLYIKNFFVKTVKHDPIISCTAQGNTSWPTCINLTWPDDCPSNNT